MKLALWFGRKREPRKGQSRLQSIEVDAPEREGLPQPAFLGWPGISELRLLAQDPLLPDRKGELIEAGVLGDRPRGHEAVGSIGSGDVPRNLLRFLPTDPSIDPAPSSPSPPEIDQRRENQQENDGDDDPPPTSASRTTRAAHDDLWDSLEDGHITQIPLP